jgi:hypothetical protein
MLAPVPLDATVSMKSIHSRLSSGTSTVANDTLRIGVLMHSPRKLVAWEVAMLRRIIDSPFAEITAVIHDRTTVAGGAAGTGEPGRSSVSDAIRGMTDGLRTKLEDKVGGCDPDAFAVRDDLDLFQHVPRLYIGPASLESIVEAEAEDAEKHGAFRMDVVIALDGGPPSAHARKLAKYGVWSLSYVHGPGARADTVGYWEVLHRKTVTGSILHVFPADEDAGPSVIGTALSATCTASVKRTRNDLHWKASLHLTRKLRELHLLGPDVFFGSRQDEQPARALRSNDGRSNPTLGDEIGLVSRIFWRIYANRIRDLFVTSQWILLFAFQDDFLPRLPAFKKIIPPSDRFWADPHVVMKDGRYYVFVEELVYAQNKGHISVMEIREDGSYTSPRPVLEEPYHLSNPLVFEHDGQFFLIPESSRNRTVDLYRCVSFPEHWQHCETLLNDVDAVDATVHFHHGKWWLFANVREYGSADDDLFLFSSDLLQHGEWKAHPRNPVVSDVTRARPAGNIFEHGQRLYRPAQDCSVRYGYGIRLQEIVTLTDSEYVEREALFIEPGWDNGIVATHTFSRAGGLTMIDALQEGWSERKPRRGPAKPQPQE